MEDISNEINTDEVSNENVEIEEDSEVQKLPDLETEVTEEFQTDDDKLDVDKSQLQVTDELQTDEDKLDVDTTNQNDTSNDPENVISSEENQGETNSNDNQAIEGTNEDRTLTEEDLKETDNLDESVDIVADAIDNEADEPVVVELGPESSKDVAERLIFEIIDNVCKKFEVINNDINDDDDKTHHEFERIEEVNEPEEQHEDSFIKEEEEEEDNEKMEVSTENIGENALSDRETEKEAEADDDEMIDEEPKLDREELILQLKKAREEEISQTEANANFQRKLGEYLRRKKADQPPVPISDAKDLTDFDQKYDKSMESLKELIEKYDTDSQAYKEYIEELETLTSLNQTRVGDEYDKFKHYRSVVAQKSINTRTGKSVSQNDLEELNANETKKELLVEETRLECIKLQNEVNKSDSILKSKEELADGLHLIDFEQFKIENQSYNEKLEERTEDLLKLRKKITSNVHVLTHVKEKLEFVKLECEIERNVLQEIDEKLNKSRDNLTRLKRSRDKLRISNDKMKRSSGMLGNRDLLRNYEDCVDTVEMQVQKMNGMKDRQIQLSLKNKALQMKIDNTRKSSSAK